MTSGRANASSLSGYTLDNGARGYSHASKAPWCLAFSLILSLLALALLLPTPAHAYAPISETHPVETTCNDRDELAGVTEVEAGAQSIETRIRIMQIFVAEAESRGITFCALSRLTSFSAVRPYARLHPDSWAAYHVDHPREDMLDLAGDVLLGRYPDVRAGAMHFDGDGMRIIFRP